MKIVHINSCFVLSYFTDFFAQLLIIVPTLTLIYNHQVMFSSFVAILAYVLIYRIVFAIFLFCTPVVTLPIYVAFQICRTVCSSMILPILALTLNYANFKEYEKFISIVLVMLGIAEDCCFLILFKYCLKISRIQDQTFVRYYDACGRRIENGGV